MIYVQRLRELAKEPLLPCESDRSLLNRMADLIEGVAYMPVPRCDGCKYWTKRERDDGGYCDYAGGNENTNNKMWTDGYDGLVTEADFGCVQFEEKK